MIQVDVKMCVFLCGWVCVCMSVYLCMPMYVCVCVYIHMIPFSAIKALPRFTAFFPQQTIIIMY